MAYVNIGNGWATIVTAAGDPQPIVDAQQVQGGFRVFKTLDDLNEATGSTPTSNHRLNMLVDSQIVYVSSSAAFYRLAKSPVNTFVCDTNLADFGFSCEQQEAIFDGGGFNITYDQINMGGGSITVQEADGDPTVTNVSTIVVSNGTLTDDGSGQVTIDTGGGTTDLSDLNAFTASLLSFTASFTDKAADGQVRLTVAAIPTESISGDAGTLFSELYTGSANESSSLSTTPSTDIAQFLVIDREGGDDSTATLRRMDWHSFTKFTLAEPIRESVQALTDTLQNPNYVADPCPEDLDGDGIVAVTDILMVLSAFDSTCPFGRLTGGVQRDGTPVTSSVATGSRITGSANDALTSIGILTQNGPDIVTGKFIIDQLQNTSSDSSDDNARFEIRGFSPSDVLGAPTAYFNDLTSSGSISYTNNVGFEFDRDIKTSGEVSASDGYVGKIEVRSSTIGLSGTQELIFGDMGLSDTKMQLHADNYASVSQRLTFDVDDRILHAPKITTTNDITASGDMKVAGQLAIAGFIDVSASLADAHRDIDAHDTEISVLDDQVIDLMAATSSYAIATNVVANSATSSFIQYTSIADLNTFTGSIQTEVDSLTAATSSYLISVPAGTISSSAQITAFGFISSSHTNIADLNTFTGSIQTEVDSLTAATSSYITNPTFPYTGSAVISGSLEVIGNQTISGSLFFGNEPIKITTNTGTENESILLGSATSVGTRQILIGGADAGGYDNIKIVQRGGGGSGIASISIGDQAMSNNTTTAAIGIGQSANRFSNGDVAVGQNSLYNDGNTYNSAGTTAIGKSAGYNQDGTNNVIIGSAAGRTSIGKNSVYLGHSAGYNASGSGVVLLGYQAGYNLTESDRLIIANTGSKHLIRGHFVNETVEITGSLFVSGSITAASFVGIESVDISDLNTFTGSIQTEVDSLTASTSSYLTSVPAGTVSSSAQIATEISGAFTESSSSFSTRVTSIESVTDSLSIITVDITTDATTQLDSWPTASYRGAIYDYVLYDDDQNSRTGHFMVSAIGNYVSYTDTSTPDTLGDASPPAMAASKVGTDVAIRISNGNGYTFKAFTKKL